MKRRTRWSIVLLYIGIIYITMPAVPLIWRKLTLYLGRPLSEAVPMLILALCVASISLYIAKKEKASKARTAMIAWLAVLAGTYAALFQRVEFMVEKIHFLEYSLLSVVAFKAFAVDVKRALIYLYTFLLVSAVGVGDELVQYVLPNRVFEIKDILLNWIGGGLGLVFINRIMKPKLGEKNI